MLHEYTINFFINMYVCRPYVTRTARVTSLTHFPVSVEVHTHVAPVIQHKPVCTLCSIVNGG